MQLRSSRRFQEPPEGPQTESLLLLILVNVTTAEYSLEGSTQKTWGKLEYQISVWY